MVFLFFYVEGCFSNRCFDYAQHGVTVSKSIINLRGQLAREILDFLQFYAKWHFGQEEDCMNKYKCPIADQNKKAHAGFLKKFDRFKRNGKPATRPRNWRRGPTTSWSSGWSITSRGQTPNSARV